uniref:ATP synthase subunit a n=1 Tax=Oncopodura yosiiana TaxID=2581075 RepID=A0A6H0EWR0_9HEXA|nr:ATP synthase F0 subunit 6 [Oncopodura yosiiana]QIT06423.1 ATP synthase F0 subunit 6 [Oncopodura yosiiana]
MMANLFSVFDPTSSMILTSNWLSFFLFFLFLTPMMWATPNKSNILISKIMMTLFNEFKVLLGKKSTMLIIFMIGILMFILFNNFLGLFPYIFTATSHLTLTLTLSLPLWLSFMLFGWLNNTFHMFAHLVPQSTPMLLMPFMVLIETISNVIRPGTLAVRLSANMIAGHLLMTLLGNQTAMASGVILFSLIIIQMLLLILETAVAFIQSYVFTILSTLYSSEVVSH